MRVSVFTKAVAASFLATVGIAQAGGYVAPVITPAVSPSVEVVAGAWQGAYIGGTLGYAFNGKDRVGLSDAPDSEVYTIDTLKLKGATAGLRVG